MPIICSCSARAVAWRHEECLVSVAAQHVPSRAVWFHWKKTPANLCEQRTTTSQSNYEQYTSLMRTLLEWFTRLSPVPYTTMAFVIHPAAQSYVIIRARVSCHQHFIRRSHNFTIIHSSVIHLSLALLYWVSRQWDNTTQLMLFISWMTLL